jgi:hypothetical protein
MQILPLLVVPTPYLPGGLMFAWLRRIRRINIFGFELEFDRSPERSTNLDDPEAVGRGPLPGHATVPAPPLAAKSVAGATGASFTVFGEVIRAGGNALGIRVRNEAELREFWRVNHIDTKRDWFGPGAPVVSIGRKQDIEKCKAGDEASLTFMVEVRAGGKRGTKTVAFQVRPKA